MIIGPAGFMHAPKAETKPEPIDSEGKTLNEVLSLLGWRSEPVRPGSGRKLVYDDRGELVKIGGFTTAPADKVWDYLFTKGLVR